MAKEILYNWEARENLKKGVDTLTNAVKVTLGPKGRNVIIDKKFGAPQITKDGVTVAKEIELKEVCEQARRHRARRQRLARPRRPFHSVACSPARGGHFLIYLSA